MSTEPRAQVWEMVQRRHVEADPEPQVMIIGPTGIRRTLSARWLGCQMALVEILAACDIKVVPLPVQLDGSSYPIEWQ